MKLKMYYSIINIPFQWRNRYNKLEQEYLQFRNVEIAMLEIESRNKTYAQEVENWKDKYGKLEIEKNKLQDGILNIIYFSKKYPN